MTYAHAAARLRKAAEARVGLSMQLYLGGRARRQRSMRYGCMTRLSAHYARRTKRPLDVVQWLQVGAQQTQAAADQTASHPASHRCAQCKRWHNLSSAKCFRSCVHAFSAALHARQFLGQIPVVLKLQRSTIYGSAQRLPQILHAFMVALNE